MDIFAIVVGVALMIAGIAFGFDPIVVAAGYQMICSAMLISGGVLTGCGTLALAIESKK